MVTMETAVTGNTMARASSSATPKSFSAKAEPTANPPGTQMKRATIMEKPAKTRRKR